MCLIKSAFVGEKNFEHYQNAWYNNKISLKHITHSCYMMYMMATAWWTIHTNGMTELQVCDV